MLTWTVPFVTAVFSSLALVAYILFDPAPWMSTLLQLTWMSIDFRVFILVLAGVSYFLSYLAEHYAFPRLAKYIGELKVRIWPERKKKRKEYKLVLESMRI